MTSLGLGIGWRAQLAPLVLRRPDLGFVEILAESFPSDRPFPMALTEAGRRGVRVIPHGVGLGLGGADPPCPRRVEQLGRLAERVGAPLVSEHVAFVRAGGREAGHLLPVARSRAQLEALVENVLIAMEALPVPLALEPIASLFEWPEREVGEAAFWTELVQRTGALLVLDVANLYANARNHGYEALSLIRQLPLDRVAYVHIAGGRVSDGTYHDTHSDAVPAAVLDLLAAVTDLIAIPGAMLERDDRFPPAPEVDVELDAIADACASGWRQQPRARRGEDQAPAPDGLSPGRAPLAAEQEALLACLLDEGPAPDRFDEERLVVSAAALRRKRLRHLVTG